MNEAYVMASWVRRFVVVVFVQCCFLASFSWAEKHGVCPRSGMVSSAIPVAE